MKVAFYLHNDGTRGVDYSKVEQYNPGVGGTQYMSVLIPTLLNRSDKFEVILLTNLPGILPQCIKSVVCGNLIGAVEHCSNHTVDIFVLDPKYLPHKSNEIDDSVIHNHPNVNFVLWAHNFLSIGEHKKLLKNKNVLRIVDVGREQYDLFRDCSFFNKTTFIYNAFSTKICRNISLLSTNKRPHNVLYVGSLIESKGFHLLARAWKNVLEAVPDAELFVIGSGALYNRNSNLGPWGLAEEEYENQFVKYLTDKGKFLPSVHFMGILGEDKYTIMAKCRVGVPNPSGLTETFGYSAVEMQSMGCYVTTMKCPGYMDTVMSKDNLYSDSNQLAEMIIRLLTKEDDFPIENVLDWIDNRFSFETVSIEWERLLLSDLLSPTKAYPLNNNYHSKRLKEIIRIKIPKKLKLCIPSIENMYRVRRKLLEFLPESRKQLIYHVRGKYV